MGNFCQEYKEVAKHEQSITQHTRISLGVVIGFVSLVLLGASAWLDIRLGQDRNANLIEQLYANVWTRTDDQIYMFEFASMNSLITPIHTRTGTE